MLEELRLRGLGVIDDAVLELGPGFTAITGETGAGKTMLLTGLGLLFGERADPALVRPGHERAEVEGRVRVADDNPGLARALEAGVDVEDSTLLIVRTVADTRSRAYVGGRSVPVGVLVEIADDLLTVHGQASQRGLLRPAVQREAVDKFGGTAVSDPLRRYQELFAELTSLRKHLRDVTGRARERAQEADLLRYGLAEVDRVQPVRGEDEALRAAVERLGHAEALRAAAHHAAMALTAADDAAGDASTLIGTARRSLDEMRGKDAALDNLGARLAEVSYLLADVAGDLSAYADGIEADPLALERAQRRLSDLGSLTRKYAATVDGVIDWADVARTKLCELDDDDGLVIRLTADHERVAHALSAAAAELSHARDAAAARLQGDVSAELTALAMPNAQLDVRVTTRPDGHGLEVDGQRLAFGPQGIDEVEILLIAHSGAPARPLHKGASGGELSRVMLALEVVLAGAHPMPTFVFDEVDAGVGGAAAVEVGRRLAKLARSSQVLVVTHLPQVAAFADDHLVVQKTDDGSVTTSGVHRVDGAERLEELARMLAGLADSESGRGHARELLAVAAAAKTGS